LASVANAGFGLTLMANGEGRGIMMADFADLLFRADHQDVLLPRD